jgi:ABC-2 type transport system ATP-binding protein
MSSIQQPASGSRPPSGDSGSAKATRRAAAREPVIVAQGLTKKYGDFTAVNDLSFTVAEGEIFGLLGPNGAGKTTTILMLLGLTEPTAGTIRVAGSDPVRDPLAVKAVVGYLPDNVGFYPTLTGRQNLRYTAALNRLKGKEAEDRISELLEQVGLSDAADKRAGSYSRGMRQRLAVADALIKRPRILILDEPTIGIDPEGVRDLLALLERLRDEQAMTILLSSHLLHQVQEICDRVGIFVGGRLIAVGPVSDLQHQLAAKGDVEIEVQTVTADGRTPQESRLEELRAALARVPRVRRVDLDRDGALLVHSQADVRVDIVRLLQDQGLLPVHVRLRGLSLDDIYARYFQEGVDAAYVPA